jgi:hypothetical protein
MDAEGCIWTSPDTGEGLGRSAAACVRVREGAAVLRHVERPHAAGGSPGGRADCEPVDP